MRIAGIVEDSIVDGPGLRFTVFTQGCPHHCPGCHNPQTHDSLGGHEESVAALTEKMLSNPLTDGLTLSGGDPFAQPEECLALAQAAHAAKLNVWAYSGWTFDELLRDPQRAELLRAVDVLVDGPFLLDERTLTLPWRGSRNQRVIDVAQSLRTGSIVTLSD